MPRAVVPRVYAAGDEPFVPLPNGTVIRIFVRDGRLGFEEVNIHIHSGHRLIGTQIADWQGVRYEFILPAGFFFSALNAPGTHLDNPAFETDPYLGRLL